MTRSTPSVNDLMLDFLQIDIHFTYLVTLVLLIQLWLLVKLVRYIFDPNIMIYYQLANKIIHSNPTFRPIDLLDYRDDQVIELIEMVNRQSPNSLYLEAIPSIVNIIKIIFVSNTMINYDISCVVQLINFLMATLHNNGYPVAYYYNIIVQLIGVLFNLAHIRPPGY